MIHHAAILTLVILLPIVPAFLLFRMLPSDSDVQGPWHGLKIKLSGAFGGYFIVLVTILAYAKTMPSHEVWTVEGTMEFEDGRLDGFQPNAFRFALEPSDRQVHINGDFRVTVIRSPDHAGVPSFPRMIIDRPGYQPMWVDLDRNSEKHRLRQRLVLNNPLVLRKIPEASVADVSQ